MYILKLIFSVVIARTEALVSGNKFQYACVKEVCELSHTLYCETLKKLCRAIQNKRRGMLTSSVVLLHHSLLPHTSAGAF
jgi:hypothetical protein